MHYNLHSVKYSFFNLFLVFWPHPRAFILLVLSLQATPGVAQGTIHKWSGDQTWTLDTARTMLSLLYYLWPQIFISYDSVCLSISLKQCLSRLRTTPLTQKGPLCSYPVIFYYLYLGKTGVCSLTLQKSFDYHKI